MNASHSLVVAEGWEDLDQGDGNGVPNWVARTLERHEEKLDELTRDVSTLLGKFAIVMVLISAVIAATITWLMNHLGPP